METAMSRLDPYRGHGGKLIPPYHTVRILGTTSNRHSLGMFFLATEIHVLYELIHPKGKVGFFGVMDNLTSQFRRNTKVELVIIEAYPIGLPFKAFFKNLSLVYWQDSPNEKGS